MFDLRAFLRKVIPFPSEVRTLVERGEGSIQAAKQIGDRGGDWHEAARILRAAGDDLADASSILTREANIRERLKQNGEG